MRRFDQGTPAAHAVPTLFTRSYLALAAEHGHAPPDVLRQAGITPTDGPAAYELSMDEYLRLLDTIAKLLGHISIGTEMGWRIPPTALGPLGAAVLSCATGHDALALCQRFWHFYGMGITLDITTTADDVCMLEFQTLPALVPATHRHMVLEAVIAGFVRGITGLQRIAREHFTIWFDLAQPAYAAQVRQRLGDVHWGMPTNCIRLPAHLLDKPLPQASPLALQDAVSQCEQTERLLGQRPDEIADRVKRELVLGDHGYPSLEAVAERLNMSTRTLRRRLQDQGPGFMDLLHAARRRDALSLLTRPALEVAQIAQMLGYADPANFTRAFRQWTGLTPSAWRTSRHKG